MFFESGRLILVVDDELSSYRGILRLSGDLQARVDHVASSSELMVWIVANERRLVRSGIVFCLVFDPKILETIEESMLDFLSGYPRICISRSSGVSTSLRSVKTCLFEFIEKPFNLMQMRALLEQAFSVNEVCVAIKKQFHSLTKREIQTCELVVQGHSNKEISEKLQITIKTVKVHRANLMRKTHATSVADLLRLYDRFNAFTNVTKSLQPVRPKTPVNSNSASLVGTLTLI